MKKIRQRLEQYLRETLDIPLSWHAWKDSSILPFYLQNHYHFFETDLLGITCVLMIDLNEEEQTPAVIRKHIDQIRDRKNISVVYIRETVTSYNRKRLIEHKISFIIPGNQMYLPLLGIDFREHLRRSLKKKVKFSPATQVMLLYVLYQEQNEVLKPSQLAHRLGYKDMSMTRAFNEMEAAGIGESKIKGKERHLHFNEKGKTLWENVLPYLDTPVKKRSYISDIPKSGTKIYAGNSALSQYTMLAQPENPVFAFSKKEWSEIIKEELPELPLAEPGSMEIEIWKYPPIQFSKDGIADRLSLYLSLKDSTDERVLEALDELLRGMKW